MARMSGMAGFGLLGACGSMCLMPGMPGCGLPLCRPSGVSPVSLMPTSGGGRLRCAVLMSAVMRPAFCGVLRLRFVRRTRGHGAVAMRVAGATEGLPPFLGFAKGLGALAGDAPFPTAAEKGHGNDQPAGDGRPSLIFSKHVVLPVESAKTRRALRARRNDERSVRVGRITPTVYRGTLKRSG